MPYVVMYGMGMPVLLNIYLNQFEKYIHYLFSIYQLNKAF